jgi:hypothetical protein
VVGCFIIVRSRLRGPSYLRRGGGGEEEQGEEPGAPLQRWKWRTRWCGCSAPGSTSRPTSACGSPRPARGGAWWSSARTQGTCRSPAAAGPRSAGCRATSASTRATASASAPTSSSSIRCAPRPARVLLAVLPARFHSTSSAPRHRTELLLGWLPLFCPAGCGCDAVIGQGGGGGRSDGVGFRHAFVLSCSFLSVADAEQNSRWGWADSS